jgi:hypothetical protein
LLDRLYAARKQLNRLIILTAPQPDEVDKLEQLLERQNKLVWQINRLAQSDLVASAAGIDKACAGIDASTKKLQALTAKVHNIAKAITQADKVIAIAAAIATAV